VSNQIGWKIPVRVGWFTVCRVRQASTLHQYRTEQTNNPAQIKPIKHFSPKQNKSDLQFITKQFISHLQIKYTIIRILTAQSTTSEPAILILYLTLQLKRAAYANVLQSNMFFQDISDKYVLPR